MTKHLSNWAGNCIYSTGAVHYPASVNQLQALVAHSQKLKVLGARHSFNAIADTTGDLISLERFDDTATIDRGRRAVTVAASVTYGRLALQLQQEGYALGNLASLPHLTVAGACATGTHGSGEGNGALATAVAALDVVTADGDRITIRRGQPGEEFQGAIVSLGGLGAVVGLTLDIEPTYDVRQDVYENLPLGHLDDHFDAIMARAYSVSLFTTWRNDIIEQVWLKRRVTGEGVSEPPPDLFGAKPATRRRHPIEGHPTDGCTEQLGIPGPWYERLPHFRMGATPSAGNELQSEYLLPRRHALAAMRAMAGLGERLAPLLQVSEVRAIAADPFWMSPCYGRDSVAIHFTWRKNWEGVRQRLPLIEAALAPLGARPHWGKLFAMSAPEVQSRYPRLADFQRLLRAYDPRGKFRNAFLDAYVIGAGN